MKAYLDLYRRSRATRPKFESPGNIVFMPVDRLTGEPASVEPTAVVNEAFISGTQPSSSNPTISDRLIRRRLSSADGLAERP